MRAFGRDPLRGGHHGQRPFVPLQQVEHMAAPTSSASTVKNTLANRAPSTHGTLRTLPSPEGMSAFSVGADMSNALIRYECESTKHPAVPPPENGSKISRLRTLKNELVPPVGLEPTLP
jgi:hypothetical protein